MKVVNSIKAHGFVKDGNVPLIVFNSVDPRAVLKSPAEIVEKGTFMYDAGEHRELACQWFEQNPQLKPDNLIIPDVFECEILLGVHDNYEFYVIGKKTQQNFPGS